jgi:thymidine phosphorylase
VFGLETTIVLSDGSQPVGRGIGPALEARDVLAVLRQASNAPKDLQERACRLAGALLELGGRASKSHGSSLAVETLRSGRAWDKFQRICEAQGGMRTPPQASQKRPLPATEAGRVSSIDNRKIARLAKLAGAPEAKAAGIEMHVRLGDPVEVGQPVCTLHAVTPGELNYALDYAASTEDIVEIEPR